MPIKNYVLSRYSKAVVSFIRFGALAVRGLVEQRLDAATAKSEKWNMSRLMKLAFTLTF
jgi:hypothetical protein